VVDFSTNPDPARFKSVSYDLGYEIMPNGDIVTSDGAPRDVDQLQLRLVAEQARKEGREITFRFVARP
jgi:hypothetical protein